MPTLIILITFLLYGGAGFLLYRERSYRYLLALLLSHPIAFFDPLWQRLFGYTYSVGGVQMLGGKLPAFVLLGSAWFYTLPAVLLFYTYRQKWWPRHYATGLVAFLIMFLYHLLGNGLLLRADVLHFNRATITPLHAPYVMFMAFLAAVVSLVILYLLISSRHYTLSMLIPVLLGGIVAAPLVVYGILSMPYWLAVLLEQSDLLTNLIAIVVLVLLGWAVHLLCWGLHASRRQQVLWS